MENGMFRRKSTYTYTRTRTGRYDGGKRLLTTSTKAGRSLGSGHTETLTGRCDRSSQWVRYWRGPGKTTRGDITKRRLCLGVDWSTKIKSTTDDRRIDEGTETRTRTATLL